MLRAEDAGDVGEESFRGRHGAGHVPRLPSEVREKGAGGEHLGAVGSEDRNLILEQSFQGGRGGRGLPRVGPPDGEQFTDAEDPRMVRPRTRR